MEANNSELYQKEARRALQSAIMREYARRASALDDLDYVCRRRECYYCGSRRALRQIRIIDDGLKILAFVCRECAFDKA